MNQSEIDQSPSDPKPRPNHREYLLALRRMTSEERIKIAFALSDRSKRMLKQAISGEIGGGNPSNIPRAIGRMSQQQLLSEVVSVLDDLEIPWMLTGSLASSLQGEPRSTHDIDIIVSIDDSSVKEILSRFPVSEFYLSEAIIREAI